VSAFATVVFSGPTLSHDKVREILGDAICLPPVAIGDVYRCMDHNPCCIAIIDGYFEGVPSVWHKEILYVMSRGVHVLGSSSMGALRAAELADFGMKGVGKIFQQFYSGELEDDDEVAVLHGPEELGFAAVSVAMVNIRETLNAAVESGVLSTKDAEKITEIAKSCFYQDRKWEHILSLEAIELNRENIAQFRSWLPGGVVDQKQLDALSLLQAVRSLQTSRPSPFKADFKFEWSEMWQNATMNLFAEQRPMADTDNQVLDELRLEAREYQGAVVHAGQHHLAQREATRIGKKVDDSELRRVFNEFKQRNGLVNRTLLDSWLGENDLDAVEFQRLMEALTRREKVIDDFRDHLNSALLDWLKLSGRYASLRKRAENKQKILEELGHQLPDDAKPGLLRWFFEERLSAPIPNNLNTALGRAGFDGSDHFYRIIFDEWVYLNSERHQVG